VGYDMAPLSLNWAGERRYAGALLAALRRTPGVEVAELTLLRREPRNLAQRVAYQALVEGLYYPLLIGRRARRMGAELVHHPRHLVPPELGLPGPSLVTVHDVLPLSQPDVYSRLILDRYRLLTRTAVRSARLVLTGSRHSAGEISALLRVSPERIRVTPYGVEEHFRPVPVEPEWLERRFGIGGPYVLCVATLEPRKNLTGAIRAFERIAGEFPEHRLALIGGTGWKSREFERLAASTKAPVLRLGYVSDEELVRLYSAADCFLFPSLSEGFGFPVLEAMACGAPVVSSDRTSLPEVVGDAGLLVDPVDEEAVAGALTAVLGSEERRAELARKGRAHAGAFTWRRCAKQTVEAYREALAA
jgi:glycosyltransferase involved in cell wall biosynthesis